MSDPVAIMQLTKFFSYLLQVCKQFCVNNNEEDKHYKLVKAKNGSIGH